jgi:hypothetical protein
MTRLLQVFLVLAGAVAAEYLWERAKPTLVRGIRTREELARAPRLYLASLLALFGGLAALSAYQLWVPSRYLLFAAAMLLLLAVGIGLRARQPRARMPHVAAIVTGGSTVLALVEALGPEPPAARAAWLLTGGLLALITGRLIRTIRARKPAA